MPETLRVRLESIDRMAGADPWASMPRLEAMWPKNGPVSWREAYDAAMGRFPGAAFVERRVAFLEGVLVAMADA